MKRIQVLSAVLALCGGALLHPAPALAYATIFSFGDSLSDVGNDFVAAGQPAPPYVAGRFSNGPIWLDDLAQALHLPTPTPSLIGGNDFAFGGARTGPNGVPLGVPVPTVQQQVGLFAASHPVAPADALYTVWVGTNDVLADVAALGAGTLTLTQALAAGATAVGNEVGAIASLVALGAKNLLVVGVPDVGRIPALNTTPLAAIGSALAQAFDVGLTQALAGIPGAAIAYLDSYSALDAVVANPGAYGFSNATAPCFVRPDPSFYGDPSYATDGSVCATTLAGQDSHLFWDEMHPTAAGHALIATLAYDEIPEPASLALLATGAALLALGRRRPPISFSARPRTPGTAP